jgi:hypothetical protein
MTIIPEDIYRILRIPFAGLRVEYERQPLVGLAALRHIFQDAQIGGRAISWEGLIQTYGPTHRLRVILACFLGCYLMPDRGQHGLEFGWGRMLQQMIERPRRYGWGQCMLAHMYHEMHEVVYREAKSMAAGVYVLQVWAWEHLPITRPICEDMRQPLEPYICRYRGTVTQPALGKTDQWRASLDDLSAVIWRPWRLTEAWDDAEQQLSHMFTPRALIGRIITVMERFPLRRVWRQYGRP